MIRINKGEIIEQIYTLNVTYNELFSIIESNRKKAEYILNHKLDLVRNGESFPLTNIDLKEADSYIKYLIHDCKISIDTIHQLNEYIEDKESLEYLTVNISEHNFKNKQSYKTWKKYISMGNVTILISEYGENVFIPYPAFSMLSSYDISTLIELFNITPGSDIEITLGEKIKSQSLH